MPEQCSKTSRKRDSRRKKLDNIIILALGPSWYKCPEKLKPGEELWAINTMFRSRKANRIFMMHDLKHEILLMDYDYIKHVNEAGVPIYTAGSYPVFDNNIEYPIVDVLKHFGAGFFLNVMCYMLALAIMEGTKKITMYGADFRTDTGHEYRINEKGAVEFWLGVAIGKKIEVEFPEESYLLKRMMTGSFYGYQQRVTEGGLVHLIPDNKHRAYANYKLVPLDSNGNEIEDQAVTTTLKTEISGVIE